MRKQSAVLSKKLTSSRWLVILITPADYQREEGRSLHHLEGADVISGEVFFCLTGIT